MNTYYLIAIIGLAALIHAGFQLSVSMLTLLSGHSLGRNHSHLKLLRLMTSFVLGAGTMTLLLLSFAALIFSAATTTHSQPYIWTIISGIGIAIGVIIWLFYHRKQKGTALWIPRAMAAFLNDRTKNTKRSAEAFSLGLTSVLAEFIFILAPISISAYALTSLSPSWQLGGMLFYTLISLIPLGIVYLLIGGGHKLSRIQKWRENNKYFIQFATGGALLVLGFFTYVNEVIAPLTETL